jgi:hypothetical protein
LLQTCPKFALNRILLSAAASCVPGCLREPYGRQHAQQHLQQKQTADQLAGTTKLIILWQEMPLNAPLPYSVWLLKCSQSQAGPGLCRSSCSECLMLLSCMACLSLHGIQCLSLHGIQCLSLHGIQCPSLHYIQCLLLHGVQCTSLHGRHDTAVLLLLLQAGQAYL